MMLRSDDLHFTQTLQADGFALLPAIVVEDVVDKLIAATAAEGEQEVRRREGRVYAMRNLLALPSVRALAGSDAIRGIVEPALGRDARVVRGIFFDKTAEANWKVAWHQDLSIAVKRRVEIDGFGPWSKKVGVVHVQPPRRILEAMLAVRLHLDDCGEENGPLKVIPGSHTRGVLPPDQIESLRQSARPVTCTVGRGGAVVVRPLILHASSPARSPSHRRVVHLEFCGANLPRELEWAFD